MRWTLLATALAAAIALGGWYLVSSGVVRIEGLTDEPAGQVLFIVAAPDEDGAMLAQLLFVADTTGGQVVVEPVSPDLEVTIPGTTYERLGDAYPFGGGAGTAEALARSRGGEALPYVVLDAGDLEVLGAARAGLSVELPQPMSVFDGTRLFAFPAGRQSLDGPEVGAVLKGAPYLPVADREDLYASLVDAVCAGLAASPSVIGEAAEALDEQTAAQLVDAFDAGVRITGDR